MRRHSRCASDRWSGVSETADGAGGAARHAARRGHARRAGDRPRAPRGGLSRGERDRARTACEGLRGRGPERQLLRQARARGSDPRHRRELRDRVHRAVGLRQVDLHPLLQPDERPDPGREGRRTHRLPRARPLRREGRPGRGAAPDRDGVPEAEPVPEVDLRQHRVRAEGARAQEGPRRPRRARAALGRALGRGQDRLGDNALGSPAVSSSASASRARSPSSRT